MTSVNSTTTPPPVDSATNARAGNTVSRNTEQLADQVSFIITHHVLPDRHDDYEKWLHNIITEAAKYKGHMGAHVMRPGPGEDIYEIAVRFATRADAEEWVNSETRRNLIHDVEPLISEPEKLNIKSGIDYWFTSVTAGNRPPKVWKQWLATASVIWPLSMILPFVLAPLFENVPIVGEFGVRQLVSALVTVGLLVYVIMPRYTRLIAKWLSR